MPSCLTSGLLSAKASCGASITAPPGVTVAGGPRTALIKEVPELSWKGAIEKVDNSSNGFYEHLFLRPKKDGSMGPIFNLKPLKPLLRYQHYKMENMAMATTLIQNRDWFSKIDLQNAVCKEHRKYPRFMWNGQVWQFCDLAFALAPAPKAELAWWV